MKKYAQSVLSTLTYVLLLVCGLYPHNTLIAQARKPLTSADLVQMKTMGFDDQTGVNAIAADGVSLDTSIQGMEALNKSGLSGEVVDDALAAAASKQAESAGAAIGSALSPTGQESANLQEPEYVNSVCYLDSTGELKPLAHESVTAEVKVHALGLGGVGAGYEIHGEHSPVHFATGSPIEFIVKLESRDVDPATQVLLYSLRSGSGKRQLYISRSYYMGLGKKSDMTNRQGQLNFAKYGQNSVKIVPASLLPPGEYAFAVGSQSSTRTAFTFGVDARK